MQNRLTSGQFCARTLPALLRNTAARHPSRVFIRQLLPAQDSPVTRSCTFGEFQHWVGATAQFLASAGVRPGDRVLLLAENSIEWQVVSLAAQALRAEPVAVFASLGAQAVCDIARRVSPRCVFVSSDTQWAKLTDVLDEMVASGLVVRLGQETMTIAPPAGVSHVPVETAMKGPFDQTGWNACVSSVQPTDPFLLLFTSGTTGRQKGVRLGQESFVLALEGGLAITRMAEEDDGLMFLPFGHVAGQCQFMLAIAVGHPLIMIARREDLQRAFELGPTYAFAVPMVYEKIRENVERQIASRPWPLRTLLQRSLRAAARVRSGTPRLGDGMLARLARALIGRRLSATLGGRLRLVASGGAAVPGDVFLFFESLGIPFVSLYGMTETCGLICSTTVDGPRFADSAGSPWTKSEIRMAPDGELLVKGPLLMQGYLDPEDEVGAYEEDGFFRTGDLAVLDETTGQVRVVGRKKGVLVLSTGKKLSPEPLEEALSSGPSIHAAMLVGEGRPYVSAIVFVAGAELDRLAAKGSDVVANVLEWVRRRLAAFSEYERPKRLLVVRGAPNDYPDLVTPTLKLKRRAVLRHFDAALTALNGAAQGTAGLLITESDWRSYGPSAPSSASQRAAISSRCRA